MRVFVDMGDQPTNADLMAKLTQIEAKLEDRINRLEKVTNDRYNWMMRQVESLEQKLIYMECQNRRNNIIIDGIPEEVGESWERTEEKALEFVRSKLGVEKVMPVERAHRIGRPRLGHHRKIIMKMCFYKDREMILKNRGLLKGTHQFVNEDFAPEISGRRQALWRTFRHLRDEAGTTLKLNYDRINVNGVFYSVSQDGKMAISSAGPPVPIEPPKRKRNLSQVSASPVTDTSKRTNNVEADVIILNPEYAPGSSGQQGSGWVPRLNLNQEHGGDGA